MDIPQFAGFRGVVHPWLCDAMGHLSTRYYMAMFDDASYHFFNAAFGYQGGSLEWAGKGWADVRQEIDYRREIGVGSLIRVDAVLSRLGSKSATARYSLREVDSPEESASMLCTTVFFDTIARKAIPLSEEMRRRAAPWCMPRTTIPVATLATRA